MGKAAKGSRKGKKAWRANIRTDDIEDFFEAATRDAHSGDVASVAAIPSQSLFFVDKSKEIPVQRKIEKQKDKVLHYESILQRNPFVQPVPSSTVKKAKKKSRERLLTKLDSSSNHKEDDTVVICTDLWDQNGATVVKTKKKAASTSVPAVEIEPLGCSCNPPFEAHQDSLATAVADEMNKIYKNELGPEPVPLRVTGEIVAEEDLPFLDADDGDERIEEENMDSIDDGLAIPRKNKRERVTRAEKNRKAHLKVRLRAEAEAKKLGNLSKEIDSLPDILSEIAKEDEEKEKRHTRRLVAKQERLKCGPPRLGRHKFEPAPVQVLLTEEITGSLRNLKGCNTLVRDRFKSLEKRGLLVPRAKRTRRR